MIQHKNNKKSNKRRLLTSHNDTCGGVVVAEGGGVPDLGGAGTCEVSETRVNVGVSHVPRGRFLVVDTGRVRVRNDVVRDVGP